MYGARPCSVKRVARDLRVRPSPRHTPPGVEGVARSAHHDEHAVGHGALGSSRSARSVSPAPKLPPRSLPIDGGGDAHQHPVRSPSRHRAARPHEERFESKSVGPPAMHTQHATLLLVRQLVQRWRAPPQHAKRAEERPACVEGRGHRVPLLGRSSQRVLQHRPRAARAALGTASTRPGTASTGDSV